MKRITDFLNECDRCELEQPTYNGCSDYEEYVNHIGELYKGAVSAVIEHISESNLAIVRTRFAEVKERMGYADFPSDETLSRIKKDFQATKNNSLLKDYTYLEMARRCRDLQIYYFSEFSKYLQLDGNDSPNKEPDIDSIAKEEISSINSKVDEETIRGIRGLANYLNFGINKAQAIVKSGVLKKVGVQFKVGTTNHFNRKKLDEVLSQNPDLFKDVHWH